MSRPDSTDEAPKASEGMEDAFEAATNVSPITLFCFCFSSHLFPEPAGAPRHVGYLVRTLNHWFEGNTEESPNRKLTLRAERSSIAIPRCFEISRLPLAADAMSAVNSCSTFAGALPLKRSCTSFSV